MPGLVDGEVCEPGYDGWVDCVPPPDDGAVGVADVAPYVKENAVSIKIVVKESRFMKYLD